MDAAQRMKLADQVWVAVARLTQGDPIRPGWRTTEIQDKVAAEFGAVAPGIQTHIVQHTLASARPSPDRYRMLTRVTRGTYRLFRPGDPAHPGREGAKMTPALADLPAKYRGLLNWYEREYRSGARAQSGTGRKHTRRLAEPPATYATAETYRAFGPSAMLLRLKPGKSGLRDVAERHDYYLVEAWLEEHGRKGA